MNIGTHFFVPILLIRNLSSDYVVAIVVVTVVAIVFPS